MTYFCCHSCDKVNAYDPGEAGALGSRLGLLLEAATVFLDLQTCYLKLI